MIVRVLDSAYISDFIDAGFSGNEIRSVVKNYAEKFSDKVVNEKLNDWEVTFRFRYNHVKQILIYLKERSYPVEKYKEITIHIPIPVKGNVPWGVDLEQYLYKDENYLNKLMKNFHCLDVDYLAFNNRQDYMINCMCRAVEYCFTEGFTINGIKVKLK
ncbi:MAG: hypothetical protein BGO54_21865 [Sphingobacteriales bacterium 46-32]|nr:MAG: hypothetical protein BGO54_21865 [Sphingobacteriales bacterium 46-32]